MESIVGRFSQYAKANPAVISAALENEFGVSSLSRAAKQHGFDVDTNDVVAFVNDNAAESKVRLLFVDDAGELRELTEQEMQGVAGGIGLAVVIVTVAIGVVAAVSVVTAAAVAIEASVWAHTSVWTYGSSPQIESAASLSPTGG